MSMNVEHLSFAYGEREVLRDVSFSVEYGEFLSVLGPNGVGKSTLFRCMLGLLTPTAGAAYIGGQAVASLSARQLSEKIAYIPQSHNPVFNFSVFDMVLMGTTAQTGSFASPGKRQRSRANKALDRLGIFDLKDRGYGSLSGGERQLVLIARAIAQEAKVLVMDEPSAALDFGNRMRVMHTVQSLTRDGYAVIQSTHDPEQAYMYSDKILALQGGRVAAFGTPQDTMDAALVSALYGVDVEVCSMRGDKIRVCIPASL
ncbi:MAG: ABC transporter ATP-binding protein [Clostridia bacterium]|nr:ABC transporter ATP-binding protein [Clostridia bacterium]